MDKRLICPNCGAVMTFVPKEYLAYFGQADYDGADCGQCKHFFFILPEEEENGVDKLNPL